MMMHLLLCLLAIQSVCSYQVGSCRLCAKGCGQWEYGGTFKTSLQHGVYKKNNVYEKGCETASTADDIDEYSEQDVMLCCKKLELDTTE